MVAGVIPVRAVGPARRDAQNPYSSDLGGSSSVDGCLLLTREMRQVYVDAGDIRCRCPAFAAGAGCRHRRAPAETMRSELAAPTTIAPSHRRSTQSTISPGRSSWCRPPRRCATSEPCTPFRGLRRPETLRDVRQPGDILAPSNRHRLHLSARLAAHSHGCRCGRLYEAHRTAAPPLPGEGHR